MFDFSSEFVASLTWLGQGLADAATLQKVRDAVVFLIALILSIAVHEFGHAFVADKLGDRTPRYQGRVTLNPLVHADPIGTLVMPLVIFFTGWPLIGWGKPVMVNPSAFTRKLRMKTAHLLVAAAGPAMNVGLAVIITIIFGVLIKLGVLTLGSDITSGVFQVIVLNWALAFFNLIPCPPLDGGTVLAGLLPDRYDNVNQFLRQYGFLILIGLLVTGAIAYFLWPAIQMAKLFTHLVLTVLHV